MSTLTPNYNLIKPGVNDPTDQDLWGGYLNTDMDIIDTTMKSISDASQLPIGSLYFNADVATNPGTLLGYGTWVAFGQGCVIIGVGTGTDANGVMGTFAQGETGGEYEHILTIPEIPAHDHEPLTGEFMTFPGVGTGNAGSGIFDRTSATAMTGGDEAHNNIQTYVTAYIWRRSA